jgi:hypothetical protein
MTKEELLKPRWKIIAAIPFKEEEDFWKVGEILDRDWGWHGNDEDGFKYHISDYPHLFKKLEWWEERKVEEMPEYLKWRDTGVVCKPSKFRDNYFFLADDDLFAYSFAYVDIATLEEYNEYKTTNP